MYDIVLEGRVPSDNGPVDAFICIKDGMIESIKRTTPGKGVMGEHHKLGRSLILPGAIDTHVHFRDPGLTAKEDFKTGSISAAFGGVTAVVDMPNTKPPTTDQRSLEEKDRIASERSLIDYGFNLALLEGSDMVGVDLLFDRRQRTPAPVGLKAFLGESTGSLVMDPIESLKDWTKLIERTGCIISLHAEDGSHFKEGKDEISLNEVLMEHDRRRPASAEKSAIIRTAKAMGSQINNAHFLHVSTSEGLEAARSSGATIEVTPHHLLLDIKWAETNLDVQAMGKVNPPLRSTNDRAALWRGIIDGTVTTLGSDHAPHLPKEKDSGILSPSGMPGVETMVPLMLMEVVRKNLSLDRLIELVSNSPATRFGFEGRGHVKEGNLADLMVVNLHDCRRIKGDDLHSKCGYTPYEGMDGIFPSRVYSRGELLVEDEVLCAAPGRGSNLRY